MAVLDTQVVEVRRVATQALEVDSTTFMRFPEIAVDVVNVEVTKVEMMQRAAAVGHDSHAGLPWSAHGAQVGHLQVLDFPVFDVAEQHCVEDLALAIDPGPGAFAVLAHHDRRGFALDQLARALRLELAGVMRSRLEANRIARLEYLPVDPIEAFPRLCWCQATVGIGAGLAVNVISRGREGPASMRRPDIVMSNRNMVSPWQGVLLTNGISDCPRVQAGEDRLVFPS